MSDLTERARLDRVYNDVYFGNGLPGLVTRMKQSEDRHEAMDERCEKSDKKVDRLGTMFWAIIVLLLSILGSTLANTFKTPAQAPAASTHSYSY